MTKPRYQAPEISQYTLAWLERCTIDYVKKVFCEEFGGVPYHGTERIEFSIGFCEEEGSYQITIDIEPK